MASTSSAASSSIGDAGPWIVQLQAALANTDTKATIDALESIDTIYSNQGVKLLATDAPDIARQLEPLFASLGCPDAEAVRLACKIIAKASRCLPPVQVIRGFQDQLKAGLAHPTPAVRLLVLNQLCPEHATPAEVADALIETGLLERTLQLLADESVAVAQDVTRVCTQIATTSIGMNYLLRADMIRLTKELSQNDSVLQVRVEDMHMKIAMQSAEALDACQAAGALNWLSSVFASDDILLKMNGLQQIAELGASQHGFGYLLQSGIVGHVVEDLKRATREDSDLFGFVTAAMCHFIAEIFAVPFRDVAVLELQFGFVDCLIDLLESSDESSKLAALNAISRIGRFRSGLAVLLQHRGLGKLAAHLSHMMMRVGDQVEQEAGLHATADLLDCDPRNPDDAGDQLRQQLFDMICRSSSKPVLLHVYSTLSRPLDDLRTAAYHVLQSLVSQQWGRQEVAALPGFIEFITDRKNDHDFEVMKWKYAIVEGLAKAGSILEGQHLLQLREYLRAGVYFKEAEPVVVVADESA